MPYGYLTDPSLASDFWAIYTVKPATTPARRKTSSSSRKGPDGRRQEALNGVVRARAHRRLSGRKAAGIEVAEA